MDNTLFKVTDKDCEWSFYNSTGKGGRIVINEKTVQDSHIDHRELWLSQKMREAG